MEISIDTGENKDQCEVDTSAFKQGLTLQSTVRQHAKFFISRRFHFTQGRAIGCRLMKMKTGWHSGVVQMEVFDADKMNQFGFQAVRDLKCHGGQNEVLRKKRICFPF